MSSHDGAGRRTVEGPINVLVVSQHDGVRAQLVAYLSRSPDLAVTGEMHSPGAIEQAHPDVLVLDLSQVGAESLHRAITAARRAGARLIALASLWKPADERIIQEAGGLYRLKSAGADGLAEIVRASASLPLDPGAGSVPSPCGTA